MKQEHNEGLFNLYPANIFFFLENVFCLLCLLQIFNPLLQRLFLDHDIIFYFYITSKNIKKNLSKVLNSFKNIMKNGAFAPKEQMLHFPYYFQIHEISKASKGVTME